MTTREENLKKINEQLEMLSDEEIEQVAGGWTEIRSAISMSGNSLNHNAVFQSKVPTYQPGVIVG